MNRVQKTTFVFSAMALLLFQLPVLGQATLKPGEATPTDSLFYVFQAEVLGYPSDLVHARFEYRSDGRVLGRDAVQLRFDGASSLPVVIPGAGRMQSAAGSEVRVLVYAEDLLLAEFSRASFLAYNRSLSYTHDGTLFRNMLNLKIWCDSPCGGGCGPSGDYDCDGVPNFTDNCTDDYNPSQSDCDNDGYGDVCDVVDGIFQATGSVKTCMTDKDTHVPFVYKTFEHHVEQRLVDVSSCGSPDRWNRWVRDDSTCYNIDDEFCCEGLSGSIGQVGDDVDLWCSESRRDVDLCH